MPIRPCADFKKTTRYATPTLDTARSTRTSALHAVGVMFCGSIYFVTKRTTRHTPSGDAAAPAVVPPAGREEFRIDGATVRGGRLMAAPAHR